MDLAKATNWLSEYIDCLLSDKYSGNKEYLSKAVGEYSLMLMIIKKYQLGGEHEELNNLQKLIPNIKQKIDYVSDSKLEKAQILLCLESSENMNSLNFSEITSKYEHIHNNIELAYIINQCGVDLPRDFWEWQLAKVLRDFLDGCETNYREVLYHFTHIIFFATNFGNDKFCVKTVGLLKASEEILLRSAKNSILEQDWDLAIELVISLFAIKSTSAENIALEEITDVLLENQRADGAYVSDGEPKNKPDLFSSKNAYSIFHTTTIAVILSLLREKHLTSQSTRTQQSCAGV